MWRVVYYLTGGTKTAKIFASLDAATRFMVYDISTWDVQECYLIKD